MKKFPIKQTATREFEVERREDAKGKLLSRRAYAPFQPKGKVYDRKGKR